MSKVYLLSLVAMLAPTMWCEVVAGENDIEQNSSKPIAVQVGDPAAGGAIASEREWEYLAALQKCEALIDAEKTRCVDAVRKEYGEM